ncbi:MAG: SUMF1/EgtB/PvdO family nonheme iron enzyme [Candidatus Brocadiaceae bacterium]|nr:SUMF1/EgtB/PvdO family nonheme iron enzyme [Candidatus Brocadiaceae bacterium]
MFRQLLPAVVCVALLVTGCEKKEEATPPPVRRVVGPTAQTPAGVTLLPGEQFVFITTRPLTVGQYMDYLEGTGQDVPVQWQDVLPGSPEAGRPVVGLSRKEAKRCAVWHMKRLPTPEEWTRAAETVRPRPYPWTEDGASVSPSAEVFLVQAYRPGSPEEQKARQEKEGLAGALLTEAVAEVQARAAELHDRIAAERTRRQLAWQEFKPAFFATVDRRRALAQERGLRAGRAEALAIVTDLAARKGGLARRIATTDMDAGQIDAEVADYGRLLAEVRANAQKARERLQAGLDTAQQAVVELSKAYEQWGASRVGLGLSEVEAMVEEAAAPPGTIALAATAGLRLDAAARRLEQMAGTGALPDMQALRAHAAQDEEQSGQLPPDESPARMAELREKMAVFGQSIGREFLQEAEVFADLEKLIELRARKEAAEAGLQYIRDALPPQTATGGGAAGA